MKEWIKSNRGALFFLFCVVLAIAAFAHWGSNHADSMNTDQVKGTVAAGTLMYILYAIGVLYLFMYVTWLYFLAVMNLDRKKDELTLPAKVFAWPIFIVGFALDVSFNLTVGTLSFLELPHELTFSERCSRHINESGWRGDVARWWCDNYLNPFDKSGKHC
jgi:hypothetical protein